MERLFTRFRKDREGLAAVEFAFVAPVMLTFFFGLFEVSQALMCRSNVTNLASTAGDLVAQKGSVNDADVNNVFAALGAMLFPYDTSKATIIIASVVDNNVSGQGKVAWCNAYKNNARADAACANGGVDYSAGKVITLPNTSLVTKGGGGSVIVSNVLYNYSSPVSSYFVGSVTMTNTFYAKPRLVAQVPHT
jgi:Flp pilus assembly protein TadG